MAFTGFSTGALALGDFRSALDVLNGTSMNAIELSALRLAELPLLVEALPSLQLQRFSYISVHAPSRFTAEEENYVIKLLQKVPQHWPIILHPDTIHVPQKWAVLRRQLMLENMDRRKSGGRTADDLCSWFELLPEAQLCLDLAHAHQFDRTMTEAYRILSRFKQRISQLHVSELDAAGHHFPLSFGTIQAFREIAQAIPPSTPAIIESINPFPGADKEKQRSWIEHEAQRVRESLDRKEGTVPETNPLDGNKLAVAEISA